MMQRIITKAIRFLTRLLTSPQNRVISLQERYPSHKFGRGTYGNLELKEWGEGAKLTMGNFCSIAPGVQIFLGGEHRPDWVTTYPFNVMMPEAKIYHGHPKTKGNVIIGHDVWIGAEAIILSGVTVGNGAVIGARAVVAKSVAPYTIVIGNPARYVRMRFEETTIEKLESIKWWDWDDNKISRALPELLSDNIEDFLNRSEIRHYDE